MKQLQNSHVVTNHQESPHRPTDPKKIPNLVDFFIIIWNISANYVSITSYNKIGAGKKIFMLVHKELYHISLNSEGSLNLWQLSQDILCVMSIRQLHFAASRRGSLEGFPAMAVHCREVEPHCFREDAPVLFWAIKLREQGGRYEGCRRRCNHRRSDDQRQFHLS
jgi:hypothetical protein